MDVFPPSLETLVNALARLPGVGRKTAQRYAFHLLKGSPDDARSLSDAVANAMSRIRRCEQCGAFSEEAMCAICLDPRRDASLICVVEEAPDIAPIDRSGFAGRYHVLGGLFSPLMGIVDPEQLRVDELMRRVDKGETREVIVATPPSPDGEATALWLARALEGKSVTVTRLGMGLPMGGTLEYADEITLQKALESRKNIK